ncbi:hypothetical protein Rs2_43504 [Raphanus sativus]|nr:hypothetical protein Rs2_43504 [Raphanus sativus]
MLSVAAAFCSGYSIPLGKTVLPARLRVLAAAWCRGGPLGRRASGSCSGYAIPLSLNRRVPTLIPGSIQLNQTQSTRTGRDHSSSSLNRDSLSPLPHSHVNKRNHSLSSINTHNSLNSHSFLLIPVAKSVILLHLSISPLLFLRNKLRYRDLNT